MAGRKSAKGEGGSAPRLPGRRSSQRLSNRSEPESGDLTAFPRVEVIIPRAKEPIMPKSRSSLATSVDDDDMHPDYETSASSLVPTPSGTNSKHPNFSAVNKALLTATDPRSAHAQNMSPPNFMADAELAARLQEAEYGSEDTSTHGSTSLGKRKTRREIPDSDSELELNAAFQTQRDHKPLAKRQRASEGMPQTVVVTRNPAACNIRPQELHRRAEAERKPKWKEIDPPKSQRPRGSRASKVKKAVVESESDEDFMPLAKPLNKTKSNQKSGTKWKEVDPPKTQRGRKENSALADSESEFDSSASDLSSLLSTLTDHDFETRGLFGDPKIDAFLAPPVIHLPRRRRGRRDPEVDPLDGMTRRMQTERLKLEQAHPEIMTMWKDLEAIQPIIPVAAPQPAGISRQLKSFQLEGLDWMIRQEQSSYKGGLLGDEMGMGKTIQAVSLIMSDFPAKQPTLVVVPPVALMQWQAEIDAYTNGKLKVIVYHGTNAKAKKMSMKELSTYNVIMVSYSGLESLYRKESKGWTRGDGIVKEDSILHSITYHRVILDEAHSIKQRTTSVARACFALESTYKWCLSGTPVQNRIGEFFSLLRFLKVKPFACYFCKACACKEIHWSQDEHKRCTFCTHPGIYHVSVFNQELLSPITASGDPYQRRAGMAKLRLITERIMLRRLKKDYTAAMELPAKSIVLHNEFFGEIEQDFSKSIMEGSQRKFDTYVSRGVMLNNYANIFGLIMQMRQVANHPDLILKKHGEGGQNVLVCSVCDEPAEEAIRSKCRHEFCRQCAKNYVRSFEGVDADCPRCHLVLSIDFDQPDIEQDEEVVKKSSIINRIKMEDWTSSTKIEMLIYDLYKLRSSKDTHKSIVFSQFTSMLQLVEWRLRRAGFSTVMLDGSMSPQQRQRSIDYFMNNVHVEVFLVSLKAGGVALNLTEASRVFIVDPWWNPAAEAQSADRCHRIGQRRPCVITRLCIEDSVESRMVLLQEKKANMIDATINNDDMAMDRLTPADMQFLFRGS